MHKILPPSYARAGFQLSFNAALSIGQQFLGLPIFLNRLPCNLASFLQGAMQLIHHITYDRSQLIGFLNPALCSALCPSIFNQIFYCLPHVLLLLFLCFFLQYPQLCRANQLTYNFICFHIQVTAFLMSFYIVYKLPQLSQSRSPSPPAVMRPAPAPLQIRCHCTHPHNAPDRPGKPLMANPFSPILPPSAEAFLMPKPPALFN